MTPPSAPPIPPAGLPASATSPAPSQPDARAARPLRLRLEALHRDGLLRVAALPAASGGVAGAAPPSADRVAGMLVGTALGDALGNTSESLLPIQRRLRFGEIRDYLPNRGARGAAVGLPSDDTQLAVWLLDELLERGRPEAHRLAAAWRRGRIVGIGQTMTAYLAALDERPGWEHDEATAWAARQHSAGNGALMRLAGAIAPHAWTLDDGLLDTVIYTSAATHDDPGSTSACVAFAEILRRILATGGACVRPGFFWQTYVECARPVEGASRYRCRIPSAAFAGPIADFVEREVPKALAAGDDVLTAGDRWFSGAYLLETIPATLHLLERHAHDPEEAVVRAVNDTWDNDTIAAIVGAVVGAWHGARAFPRSWRRGLLGRTMADDDGHLTRSHARLVAHGGPRVDDPGPLPIGEHA